MPRPKRDPNTPTVEETPRQRFVRLATVRTTKALKATALIANLYSRGYDFSEADVDAIDAALAQVREEVTRRGRAALAGGGKSNDGPSFTLPNTDA